MKNTAAARITGFGALCFGAGILFSMILPLVVLVFVEAAILVTVGLLRCSR